MNPLPNDPNSIPAASIAGMIDHTILKPDTTESAVKKICEEAIKYQFASVCISPSYVAVAANELAGSSVKVCTVIGFPSGAHATAIKVAETKLAIEQGAAEIDMVINIGAMKSENFDLVFNDILLVCQACHANNVLLKVIIETALLTADEKQMACELAKKANADFVKTSTGFASGGATAEDIALMRKTVGEKMGVKASGGVRTYEDAVKMIKAGATRIGASASIKIIQAE